MLGIIIQARLASTRLPKKVVAKIEGNTVLEHVIARAKNVKNCDVVVVATTDGHENDIVARIAKNSGAFVFRGSEMDVLDRYYRASKAFGLDAVVRITADCPLLDPRIAGEVVDSYLRGGYDYVSNNHPPTYPDGMDVEVFSFNALEKSWREAKLGSEREHVTPFIVNNSKKFKIGSLISGEDYSRLRLTLDEKDDLVLIKKIFKKLYHKNKLFGLDEIIYFLASNPELLKINKAINRNEGYLKSIREDEKNKRNIKN